MLSMRSFMRGWITLGVTVLALGGCGEEPMDAEEFRAYVNTACANARPTDSDEAILGAMRDARPPAELRDDFERALDHESLAEARDDLRALGLDYCVRLR
jgi:hypothetical protein